VEAVLQSIDESAVLWWLFLFVVWKVHRRLVGYKGINTFSIFLPYVIVTNGVLVPVANQVAYEVTGVDISLTSYPQYWTSLGLMYVSLLAGIGLANVVRQRQQITPNDLSQTTTVGNRAGVRTYVVLVVALCVISIVQIYGAGQAFDFVGFVTLKMTPDMYEAHRYGFAEATRGIEWFLYNKLPYGIAPVAIILVWNNAQLDRWKRLAFVLVLAFAIVQTGHKMPLVFLLGTMIFSRGLIRRQLALSGRTLLLAVGLLLALVFAILPFFYLMQGNETYEDSLFWSVQRLFLEQSRVLQLHFEVYPNVHPHLNGASTSTIAALMGVTDYVPPSVYIPVDVLGIENTSYPALFIGEGWADFGYRGVALTSLFVGFLLQMYNIWFYSQRRPRLEETATFLAIVFSAYHLLECNVLTTLFSYGLLSSFLIYLFIRKRNESPAPRAHTLAPVHESIQ
jgi:hypothetical protein